MKFRYGIDQANPCHSEARSEAQRRAMWITFSCFLKKASGFILHFWPLDPDVAPFLAMGFEPEPIYVSPKARQLRGALTPELRQILWGPGEGEVPWFKVELTQGSELIYYFEEQKSTAAWNCTHEDLQELFAAGLDPCVVADLEEQRRQWDAW